MMSLEIELKMAVRLADTLETELVVKRPRPDSVQFAHKLKSIAANGTRVRDCVRHEHAPNTFTAHSWMHEQILDRAHFSAHGLTPVDREMCNDRIAVFHISHEPDRGCVSVEEILTSFAWQF